MPLQANTPLGPAGPYPFADARLKLDRARFHLHELEDATARFAEGAYSVVFSYPDTDDGWHVRTIRIDKEPPPTLGVIAGEVAYQLRSALDHIAFQLVNVGRGREVSSHFPIAWKCKDYWKPRGRRPSMREEGLPDVDTAFREVIDGFQPFKARRDDPKNDPLTLLSQFTNRDKHRVVHPVWAVWNLVGADAVALDPAFKGRIENVSRPPGRIEDGQELHRYRILGGITPVKPKGDLVVNVAFGERPYRIADFRQMNSRVLDVIEALEDVT